MAPCPGMVMTIVWVNITLIVFQGPSKYGSMSSDKKPYTYTLEKYLPPPALYELEDYDTMHSQVSSVLEQDEEEESERNGHTDDAVYGTTKF